MKKFIISIATLSSYFFLAQSAAHLDTLSTKEIKEVSIVKKTIEKKSDRLVYNVGASPISKGTNGFDLLKQTPMLTTTDDKTLKILGKTGTRIYINGKESKMDADAIVDLLKNMPGENIQKIEVITVPSSEFQVNGNEGIINIILKKNPNDGINGNLKIDDKQGYYNSPSASASLNIRKGRLGISTNLNGSYQNRIQEYSLANGNYGGASPYKLTSEGYVRNPAAIFGGYLNTDYAINDSQNLSLSYNFRTRNGKNTSTNFYNELYDLGTNQITQRTKTQNMGGMNNVNHDFNLNYDYTTDENGSKLSIATSYMNYHKEENNINSTLVLDDQKNEIDILGKFAQTTPLKINNYAGQVDYIQKMKKELNFSIGLKYNNTKTESQTTLENLIPPTGLDPNQSNLFTYTEKVLGGYFTAEKNFSEQVSTKAGFRIENTKALGRVLDKNLEIERNNTYFLPYININYNPNSKNNLSYAFSSRVTRPSFWQLNPARIYLTATNYIQNNPFAKAERSYNHELQYMYNSSYYVTASYNLTKDASEQIPLYGIVNATQEKVLSYIRTNYGDKQEFALSFGVQKQLFKGIWNMNNVLILGHNTYKGEVDGDPTDTNNLISFQKKIIDYKANYFQIQLNNNIRLSAKKDWYLGINYFYLSKLQLEVGALKPLQSLDLSLKKIYNNWTFNLNVQDIFATSRNIIDGTDSNGNFNYVDQYGFNRSVSIGVTYSFGNQKLKKINKAEGANEEVRRRTSN